MLHFWALTFKENQFLQILREIFFLKTNKTIRKDFLAFALADSILDDINICTSFSQIKHLQKHAS